MNKSKILTHCKKVLQERKANLEDSLRELKEAVEGEEKSTAGDKHDTARAMIHLEQEKLGKQLKNLEEETLRLARISPESRADAVQIGSFIETNKANYFIGPSLGKLRLDDSIVFAISLQAPLTQVMMGKRVGETFSFNGMEQKVISVS